jgi:hypothetical protein
MAATNNMKDVGRTSAEREREFAREFCEFWQANRIPQSRLWPRVRFARWLGTDTEKNYLERGNKEFSIDSVGYEFNSLGYRGPELQREPGEQVAMFLGCSITIGEGMPWEDLWTSLVTQHLERRWGAPVRQCNLAWGGTGSDYSAMLLHQAVDVLRPDAVFVLWSFTARMTWFANARTSVTFLPGIMPRLPAQYAKEGEAYLRLATDAQGFFNFVRNFHFVYERLLPLGVPYYWGMVEPFSREMLKDYVPVDRYIGDLRTLDVARDAAHPGRESHLRFADLAIRTVDLDGGKCAT